LEGDGENLRKSLERDMSELSKNLEFEEAQKVKDTLFALEHIRDAHLIQREVSNKMTRIEGYDVSHISGTDRVGVMTVVRGGVADKSQYKKFKLSKDKNDDLEGLKEIFTRRLKHLEDWGVPEVVVLDGDDRHLNTVKGLLAEMFASVEEVPQIKVVSVVKDKTHKAKAILGDKETIDKFKQEILLVNAEAHRFAIGYHRLLRSKSFVKVR
jgi:excinuclease ABC subunit C